MTDVFISYSKSNMLFVEQLYARFKSKNIECWVDWKANRRSIEWWQEITSAIDFADNFVFIISPDSIRDIVCHLQLEYAIRLTKRIIVVSCEFVDFDTFDAIGSIELNASERKLLGDRDLSSLVGKNLRIVGAIEPINLYTTDDFEEGFASLVFVIQTDMNYVREHTEYLRHAMDWERNGENEDYLLRGVRLTAAMVWLAEGSKKSPFPTDIHLRYILESQRVSGLSNQLWQRRVLKFLRPMFQRMPQKLFLSYRRSDVPDACGRIYDRLSPTFGNKNVFYDQVSIEFGEKFRERIEMAITECFAMLVIIGPQWERIMIERTKDDEPDYVKIEIEIALRRKHVTVIPVLVGGATMPDVRSLPESLAELLSHNAAVIRSGREFNDDISELIKSLRKIRSQPK